MNRLNKIAEHLNRLARGTSWRRISRSNVTYDVQLAKDLPSKLEKFLEKMDLHIEYDSNFIHYTGSSPLFVYYEDEDGEVMRIAERSYSNRSDRLLKNMDLEDYTPEEAKRNFKELEHFLLKFWKKNNPKKDKKKR